MSSLNTGKHITEEISGEICTLVEAGINKERVDFLTGLLGFNGYEVRAVEDENKTWRIGVTDLLFNPVIDVYKRRLKTPTGHIVTPAYWLQLSMNETEEEVNYWTFGLKKY